MGRKILGVALCSIAAFMLLGFTQAGLTSGAAIVALMIGAGIPGAAGVALLLEPGRKRALSARNEALRRETLESEILRLASRSGNKLTVVEVVSELAVGAEEASAILDALAARDVAELQVTESGGLVYAFPDLDRLQEKDSATGLLGG